MAEVIEVTRVLLEALRLSFPEYVDSPSRKGVQRCSVQGKQAGLEIIWEGETQVNNLGEQYRTRFQEGNFHNFMNT